MSTSSTAVASRVSEFLHPQQRGDHAQQHGEHAPQLGEHAPQLGEHRSLEHQLNRTLRAMRTQMGMDVAFTSRLKDGRRLFNHVDSNFPHESLVPHGHVIVDASCAMDEAGFQPAGAHITIPIRLSDGQIYGTFSCYSSAADPYHNERDHIMLRVFAEIATELIAADIEARHHHIDMEVRIKSVLSTNSFSMVYQPIHVVTDNRLIGFESLTRFSAPPSRGPDVWFHEAAQVGLDIDLECRAIQLALDAMHFLPSDIFIAVNASPKTIISGNLDRLFEGWPIKRLVLEVTEHATIDLYGELAAALAPLRQRGLRLAIDDAGAGYSSFRHILNLEPDIIKLDMSLTRNIDTDSSRRALTAALVRFANETDCEIVAEGVETAAELSVLRDLGIKYAQGYYLGKPMVLGSTVDHLTHATARIA